ncbi:hypothetical protein OO7_16255 (plasmid) [Providencia sneebia DSM 19967]|uniref:Uncharacterized protein n=1 Tax=Providencia sneebia DSM 19967 TaxID=1141660 RepID=K8VXK4_9GAMM|nr:hypothetical protein OO7_16255 [Providencia sneebia DSM 19967]
MFEKLNNKDKNKLKSIYESLETNTDFNSWIFILFHKKNILPIMSLVFLISELLIIISIDNYIVLSSITLLITCLTSTAIIIWIDSFLERIPFFFYIKIKIKLILIKLRSYLD